MAAGEHVHSNNALCPECCRLIASPHYKAMSVLNDILYPLKGFLDDATDEIGNVLTRMMGKDPDAPPQEIEAAEPLRRVAPGDTHFGKPNSPRHAPIPEELDPNDTVRTTTWVDQPSPRETRSQRDVLTTPLPREPVAAEATQEPAKLVGTDWASYAKSNYLKIRKSQELDAAPTTAAEPPEAPGEDEEVRLRGKIVAKRVVPITPMAMMGLQLEGRVQTAADAPKEVEVGKGDDLTDLLGPDYHLKVQSSEEQPIKPRDWMSLIATAQTDSGSLPQQPRQEPRQQVIYEGAPQFQHVQDPQPQMDQYPAIHSWREEVEKPHQLRRQNDPQVPVERRHRQHNHDGRTVCEECMNQMARPGNHAWEETKENLLVFGRGALAVAQVVGIGIFGAGMALATIFPNTIQPQTLEQQKAEEERRLAAKKKKNELDDEDHARWEEDQNRHHSQKQNEHKAWEDAEGALWRAKRISHVEGEKAADDEFWKAYNSRHDETASEKKAWEDARTAWETEKANKREREKNDHHSYLDQRQQHWATKDQEEKAWWADKQRYEEERDAKRQRQKEDDDKYAEQKDNAFWNDYDKAVKDINSMGVHPIFDTDDNRRFEDDQRVGEVNSLLKAVEDGKEDPRKLADATRGLQDERRAAWDREQKKAALHDQARGLEARARDAEKMAQMASSRGDYDAADRHAREADSLWRDADGVLASYRNV